VRLSLSLSFYLSLSLSLCCMYTVFHSFCCCF
jgi:hypothetical protein